MLNKIFKSGLIGVFALVIAIAFTSCQKEKETIGIIIVKYSNGQVVPNADVTLFPKPVISLNKFPTKLSSSPAPKASLLSLSLLITKSSGGGALTISASSKEQLLVKNKQASVTKIIKNKFLILKSINF